MKYVTITASSYEEAVEKAKSQYGDRARIHSRRDYAVGGGLFSRKKMKCDLTLYLVDGVDEPQKGRTDDETMREFEKEAQTPDPTTISKSERLNTEVWRGAFDKEKLSKAEAILRSNSITEPLYTDIIRELKNDDNMEMNIAERIMSLIKVDLQHIAHPKHYLVLLGATGSGKTTTSAKIAALYSRLGLKVSIISLDSYRVGAFEQAKHLSDAFGIPVELIRREDEFLLAQEKFHYSDLVIIDTMGISPSDNALNLRLRGMIGQLDKDNTNFTLVASASTKEDDLMEQFSRYNEMYPLNSLIASKLDETSSMGSILSFSYRYQLPLLFVTTGQNVPEDMEKASSTVILSHLKDLGLDMDRYESQVRRED